MKKYLFIIAALLMVSMLCSCSAAAGLARSSAAPTKTQTPAASEAIASPAPTAAASGSVFGSDWPDNDFTHQIPKPESGVSGAVASDNDFSFLLLGASAEDAKAYARKCIDAGFTIDLTESEPMEGIYSFAASNPSGYAIEIDYALETCAVVISK